jgi:sulfur relay (sulfurtransferase) complex TusBCD TusD component (DsrE family)
VQAVVRRQGTRYNLSYCVAAALLRGVVKVERDLEQRRWESAIERKGLVRLNWI